MQQARTSAGPQRRELIAGVGACVIAGRGRAATPATFDLGVQLWTLDTALRQDLDRGLAILPALGVTAVETAGLYGHVATTFAAALGRAGLTCLACHVPQSALNEDLQHQIDDAAALGARHLVCAAPQPSRAARAGADWALGIAEAMSLADWHRTAETLDRTGLLCSRSGMRAAYHNHSFEFALYDGRRAIDVLAEATDASLVDFELDVGWAYAAGIDPVAVMRDFADRVRLLHLKDMRRDGAGGWRSGPLGSGEIDWVSVLRTATEVGISAGFVEQDPPFETPPLESLRASFNYLRVSTMVPAAVAE